MITEKENTRISKFLSLVLRHKPETIGIQLGEGGWVPVDELIQKMNEHDISLSSEVLNFVVERFAFNENHTLIRASQGHSVEIELGYHPATPPDVLYHGTTTTALDSIRLTGLEKRQRHHVHMRVDMTTAQSVGQRYGEVVILQVVAHEMQRDGFLFYCSVNNVWLTDHVPVRYLRLDDAPLK